MKRTASALTIAKGRETHLANVIRGLIAQDHLPEELVIAVMQDAPYTDLPEAPFPVRQIHVTAPELPLAAARNAAARAARGDVLVFLDVDCIPAPSLIGDYLHHAAPEAGLLMGEVMYLPAGAAAPGWTYEKFEEVCVRHSDRQGPPAEGLARCEDYRCFWSLNFAMHREVFAASGGFDERYQGYGAEDTDFGRTLDDKGIAIHWMKGARVYHQHHAHHMPPVHHLRSVLRNAEVFASKWGHRTMEHWLYAFQLMGLIENTPEGLRILRDPDERDFALSRQQSHMPYANTRRVLDLLQGKHGKGAQDNRARMREVEQAQAQMLLPAAE